MDGVAFAYHIMVIKIQEIIPDYQAMSWNCVDVWNHYNPKYKVNYFA